MKPVWPIRTIGECAKFLSGGTPSKSRPEFWQGEIPWVSSGEMVQRRISDTSLRITPDAASEGSRLVPANTVMAVVRGMSLAKEFRVAISRREVAFNQDLKAFACAPDVLPEFLFYALLAHRENIRELATEASHGTKKLETAVLSAFQIAVPDRSIQQRVIGVLSAYDDLIENNSRRIQILEQSARLLYEEWFVRLRFPGHLDPPTNDSAPAGWHRKSLGELSSLLKRGIAPHYDDEAEGLVISQKCIRDRRLTVDLARRQSREVPPERQVQIGDVLINSTGEGTLGRIAQVKAPVPNCTVDTHVTIARPKPGVPWRYFGLAVMAWESQFSTMGRGSTNQTELSPAAIGATEVLLPHKTVTDHFEEFASPVFDVAENLAAQNRKLTVARDLLLPRLMSGDITL